MARLTDAECLKRLRSLWKEALHCHDDPEDAAVLRWANNPENWAENVIRHSGKSFHMAETVVRHCRSLRARAARAVAAKALNTTTGADPFDPLMPVASDER
jgi:hypothetical protein